MLFVAQIHRRTNLVISYTLGHSRISGDTAPRNGPDKCALVQPSDGEDATRCEGSCAGGY